MGATMSWGSESTEAEAILDQIRGFSVRAATIEADLSDTASPTRIFDFCRGGAGSSDCIGDGALSIGR